MSDHSSGQSSIQTVNGGISLFLLTFIILCLVSFAALSIVSARADARLTEKYRQQTEYYYGARNEAQKFLQGLDSSAVAGGSVSTGGIDAGADGMITRRFPAGPHMDLILTVQTAGGQYAPETPAAGGEATSEAPAAGGEGTSETPAAGGKGTSEALAAGGEGTSEAPAGSRQDSRNYHVICEKTESTITYNYDSTLPVMKR